MLRIFFVLDDLKIILGWSKNRNAVWKSVINHVLNYFWTSIFINQHSINLKSISREIWTIKDALSTIPIEIYLSIVDVFKFLPLNMTDPVCAEAKV